MSIQKASGNMYEWVDYVHSYLRGACPYACPYCYVQAIAKRFNNQAMTGPLRFDEKQLEVDYGNEKYKGKTIFIEHTHDLFIPTMPSRTIDAVLLKCKQAYKTRFVFQTRNVQRVYPEFTGLMNPGTMIGTTIESTNDMNANLQPSQSEKAFWLEAIKKAHPEFKTFVTIEPILDFDVTTMIIILKFAKPDFVNIGADSKGTGLKEPSKEKVLALIDGIKGLGIEIRTKRNLERLIGKEITL